MPRYYDSEWEAHDVANMLDDDFFEDDEMDDEESVDMYDPRQEACDAEMEQNEFDENLPFWVDEPEDVEE